MLDWFLLAFVLFMMFAVAGALFRVSSMFEAIMVFASILVSALTVAVILSEHFPLGG